jgi:hypothetical protein
MIFNIKNQQDELSFDFDGIVLNSVNKHKHLGIIFSSDCKWTKHIDSRLLSPSMSSAMSFMNTKNNRGPRTDPWGTPAFKSLNSDNASLIATFCDLLVR